MLLNTDDGFESVPFVLVYFVNQRHADVATFVKNTPDELVCVCVCTVHVLCVCTCLHSRKQYLNIPLNILLTVCECPLHPHPFLSSFIVLHRKEMCISALNTQHMFVDV